MKKLSFVLYTLLFFVVGNASFAKKKQKTELKKQKAELKAWKKRKAAIKPLQLKELVEENHRLKSQNQELLVESKLVKDAIDSELIMLKMQIAAQQNEQYEQSKEARKNMLCFDGLSEDDWDIDQDGRPYVKGLIFKVQIGAYKGRNLSNILEDKNSQGVFEQEKSGEINTYTLRHFRDYWKANQFKKELRAMGIKDAWIVALKNGERVVLKEVIQEIVNKK